MSKLRSTESPGLVESNGKNKKLERNLIAIEATRKALRELVPWLKRNRLLVPELVKYVQRACK
jgi:hypothetical protein